MFPFCDFLIVRTSKIRTFFGVYENSRPNLLFCATHLRIRVVFDNSLYRKVWIVLGITGADS